MKPKIKCFVMQLGNTQTLSNMMYHSTIIMVLIVCLVYQSYLAVVFGCVERVVPVHP